MIPGFLEELIKSLGHESIRTFMGDVAGSKADWREVLPICSGSVILLGTLDGYGYRASHRHKHGPTILFTSWSLADPQLHDKLKVDLDAAAKIRNELIRLGTAG